MRSWRRLRHRIAVCAVSVLVLALAPAVLLGGELVNRHYLHGRRTRPARTRPARVWPVGTWHGLRLPGLLRRLLMRPARTAWLPPRAPVAGPGQPAVTVLLANPVWIALTAPARWLTRHLRPRAGGRRRGRGNGPPSAGVREPRRPLPDPSAGAMALPEPRWPG